MFKLLTSILAPVTQRILPIQSRWIFKAPDSNCLSIFALKRSGHHLIIDWICRGHSRALHLNNCKFKLIKGMYATVPHWGRANIYQQDEIWDSGNNGASHLIDHVDDRSFCAIITSFENPDFGDVRIQRLAKKKSIFVIRDPFNWLASMINHPQMEKMKPNEYLNLYKFFYRESNNIVDADASFLINYNRFIGESEYRAQIHSQLGLGNFEFCEQALTESSRFGGGSSFGSKSVKPNAFLERWRHIVGTDAYTIFVRDEEVKALTLQNFQGSLSNDLLASLKQGN